MIFRLGENVWKLQLESNIYLLKFQKTILIDAGCRGQKEQVEACLKQLVSFQAVDAIILTHLHYDHSGNLELFPNAEVFASARELEDYRLNPNKTVLTEERLGVEPKPIEGFRAKGLRIVHTPGHTGGSICIWVSKSRILFSGDTLFNGGGLGRTDFPTSAPEEYQASLAKLKQLNYRILAPGHG
jgi:hydroxyacylglutathione hydrolase